jgi:hypothetical protein
VNPSITGSGSVLLRNLTWAGSSELNQQLWLPLQAATLSPSGYNLINFVTGKVLDDPMHEDGGEKAGIPLQQYSKNTGLNQQWNLVQAPGHTYPTVTVTPGESLGPGSELYINGEGFTDYKGQGLTSYSYGVPVNVAPGATSLDTLVWGPGFTATVKASLHQTEKIVR